ncbi:MAG TPA: nucleoside monophosphate kinase, partial [Terriglobales bacterium]|nr:nucleoside monophosphate kinase [Terriglobales bacterium]
MDTELKQDRAAWLYGPPAQCAAPHETKAPSRLVLLGAPGVGKGTQAQLLAQRFGGCHLSTGDVFRAAKARPVDEQTPALAAALDSMRRGALISDSLVSDLIRERIGCIGCLGGFILDGFPRTIAQAIFLEQILEEQNLTLSAVVNYELPQAEIVTRLSGRRTCADCRATSHIFSKTPRRDGMCDHCGGNLYQREDDRAESIEVRLDAYARSTAPLISFYQKLDLLVTISATGSADEIHARTMNALTARLQPLTALRS